jgi:tetratricopeptide (TPR) repeat protein
MTARLQAGQATAASAQPAVVELRHVPFVPLTDAAQARHCGPQALASSLQAAGLPGDVQALSLAVYLPARGGSLQIEMLAAARRAGALAVQSSPTLQGLMAEIDAGHPVLVLQNLGLNWLPRWATGGLTTWHYAVLTGYDRSQREFILHSGDQAGQRLAWSTFEYTWARSAYWGAVLLAPGDLPAASTREQVLQAALDFERSAPAAAQVTVWRSVLARWPDNLLATLGLAGALQADTRIAEAAELLLTRAPALDSAAAWNNLALMQMELGRWAEARSAVEQALDLARRREPRWLAEIEATAATLAARTPP